MEPKEYDRLQRLAEERGISVSQLIYRAIRRTWLDIGEQGSEAVEDIAPMRIPLPDWPALEREIEEGHDAGLP